MDGMEGISHLVVTKNAKYLITGDDNGFICVRNLDNLELIYQFDSANSAIRSVAFIYEQDVEKYLLAGLNDGKLMIFIFDPSLWSKESKPE